jgi:hypothetical protein
MLDQLLDHLAGRRRKRRPGSAGDAVNLFITDMLARRLESAKGNGVTTVAMPFQ